MLLSKSIIKVLFIDLYIFDKMLTLVLVLTLIVIIISNRLIWQLISISLSFQQPTSIITFQQLY